jgi:hypothetical protein
MDFVPHFWKLLLLRSIEAVLTVQPKVECSRYQDNSRGPKKISAGLLQCEFWEELSTSIYLKKTGKDLCKPDHMMRLAVFRAERRVRLASA